MTEPKTYRVCKRCNSRHNDPERCPNCYCPDSEIRWSVRGLDSGPCRGCNAIVFWATMKSGRRMPLDRDGRSHFATCPRAGKFRKGVKK